MLEPITDSVRARLPDVRARKANLLVQASDRAPALDVVGALSAEGLSVIAEVKRKSPSAGVIRHDVDPAKQAAAYELGGAAMISVLTERDHFGGSPADFAAVRSQVSIPLLRKDFIVDEVQIIEARAMGADCVLLIVAILSDDQLEHFSAQISELGMTSLVEAHTDAEVERALRLSPQVLGVNNRDLTTFETSLETAEALASKIAHVPVTVGESGISTIDDARRMAHAGYDAVLVGEALVRADDPGALIASFREHV